MPAFQQLVLTDRKATPVAHTLIPNGKSKGDAPFYAVAENLSVEAERPTYSVQVRRVNGRRKTRVVFRVPVVQTETINGIATPKVVREGIVDATFTFSALSTEAERNDVIGMFADSLSPTKVLVHDTLVKAQDIY